MSGSDLSIELPIPIPARLRERLARIPKAPSEGWLTVLALATLLVATAWSVDEPGWIGGNSARTDYLPNMAFLGLAIGFAGAKAGWGRWTTHLVGALFAAIILPLIAGDLLLGDAVSGLGPAALGQRYMAAADASYRAWYDLAILDLSFTREWGHYVIAIGGLIWGTAQYAAYAVFGHRRPLDAVIAVGLVLLVNMATTTRDDQLHLMVLASLGALMLLSRSHAFEEKATWIRRRIGDPSAVTSLYLRGGSAFIAAAIVGSLTLTATASSSPLQSFWEGVPQRVISALDWLRKILPSGGNTGGGIVIFGQEARAAGVWFSSNEVAFTADLAPDEGEFRWRATTYSEFILNGWQWGPTQTGDRTANSEVLFSTPEDPEQLPGRREVVVEIHLDAYSESLVLSPQTIYKVDQPTRIDLTTGSRWFTALSFANVPQAYTVTALVPVIGDEGSGLTINRLKAAGENYPASIRSLYLDVPDGSLGPDGQQLLEDVKAVVGNKTPYEKAHYVETFLRVEDLGGFHWVGDIRGLACDEISMVECFARFKQGYCQYYAATMAILLRAMGVPTRFAQGFLPGTRDASGHEVVRLSGAHSWVEVYFPDIGWVDFDPTGGGFALEEELPLGSPVPSRTPGPSFTPLPENSDDDGGPSRSPGTNLPPGAGPTGAGPYIAIGILLMISMAGLVYIAWRRGPRRPMEPDVAWRGVLSIARRFGFGPRPAQTVFEYAGALGDEVPQVRPELQTVARGKVEVAYGHRNLGDDRKRAIAEASRALRVGLLRLAFRRRGRKKKGPRAI